MHPWFRWIFYLNPGAYAFESLMVNEFQGLELECVAPQYVPFGTGYNETEFRGCTVPGSDGSGMIHGVDYIHQQYGYAVGHLWRGFGVIVGLWIFFLGVTALGFELKNSDGGSSVLLFKRSVRGKREAADPEKGSDQSSGLSPSISAEGTRQSTFTWHDLDYFVKSEGSQKQLLNKIFGYVRPGNLTALMGASGAGKTT